MLREVADYYVGRGRAPDVRLHRRSQWPGAPTKEDQVGSRSGSVGGNQTIEVEITPIDEADGVYTVIIEMDSGGNDIWFGSKESSREPVLTVVAERAG